MATSQTHSLAAPPPQERRKARASHDEHATTDPAIRTERTENGQTEGRGLVVAPPSLLQRVLLTTDGNIGRILENYAGEAIAAVKLDQISSPGGEPCHALELEADEERLTRSVLLRGSRSGRSLLYADTLVAIERLHPLVRTGLLSTSEPIGRLLTVARVETFRDILSAGQVQAGAVAAHFGIAEDDELFVRTYRIMSGGRPLMLITEKFPTTSFR